MDLIKIGNFITELRKEKGYTQEELGDKLYVTNKTVSRWETGKYLPSAEILLMMSDLFDVSINEILKGQRISGEEEKTAEEENIKEVLKSSVFTTHERIDFFKAKWEKDHRSIHIMMAIFVILGMISSILMSDKIVMIASVIIGFIFIVFENNRMMSYVENKVYVENRNEYLSDIKEGIRTNRKAGSSKELRITMLVSNLFLFGGLLLHSFDIISKTTNWYFIGAGIVTWIVGFMYLAEKDVK